MTITAQNPFRTRAESILTNLRDTGQYKQLQMIEGPMGPVTTLRGHGECLNFCSNNYLGLAHHPEVVEAGISGLSAYGAGTASVRFICGTFAPHEILEHTIARFLGVEAAYTFVSCWNATEAVFPTLAEPGDAIISDELNHACIIDSVRLATVIKKGVHKFVYHNNDMDALRGALTRARNAIDDDHAVWVVTDGVFSMEGSLANLPAMRALCDEFGAVLVVDDSHGTGVMGKTGRGTHEHHGMSGTDIDLFTGTLGKALGGGAGGYIAGPKFAIDLIVQRARPTLFSNALPVTVACSANKAIEILMDEPQRVQKLRDNVAYARKQIRAAGFEVLDSPTAICAIIVGDTAKAISMSKRLLELGVYVIGFGYPVVPEGTARLRIQLSAAHETAHIDSLVEALKKL
ncbi:MAG: aminotransferase class I/II-fold pyridoxal phosphate-dependent enzyme [Phycisphaeraceae bacterium]|nr:aminotransferase class I/II-fold pyridoxal phosphate-dependent enzyme [Phycisphaeraceae bacterium]MCB9847080.1 aminotransferase class I/II-fold pyridoxal phosphate-dependent enzyme [Phycisphaeraceae bacterium]